MLIVVRPHRSLWDGPKVAWRLYRQGYRNCLFAVDPDYACHPVWGRVLRLYGHACGQAEMLPLDTSRPFSLRALARLLREGRTVVIFPQGIGLNDPHRPDRPGWRWLIAQVPGLSLYEIRI